MSLLFWIARCAKASTNVDSNPVPVINPGSGPQTNNIVNINSDAGGDKSGKTQGDDVKIVKSDAGKAQWQNLLVIMVVAVLLM